MSYNNGLSSNNTNKSNGNGNGTSSNNGNGSGGNTSSSTYQNVTYKKQEGTLILTENVYTFYPLKKNGANGATSNDAGPIKQSWLPVLKHQVSPVTHARHLLKLTLQQQSQSQSVAPASPSKPSPSKGGSKKTNSVMFEFKSREDVERIRKDVSNRLLKTRQIHALNAANATTANNNNNINKKRSHGEMNQNQSRSLGLPGTHNINLNINNNNSPTKGNTNGGGNYNTNDQINNEDGVDAYGNPITDKDAYTHLTKSQFKVASSCLLASYPTLRTQHSLLLQQPPSTTMQPNSTTNNTNNKKQTPIISNDFDFWGTHDIQQSNQLSKIIGVKSRGLPSTIKSSLDIQINTSQQSSSSSSSKKEKKEATKQNSNFSNANAITLGVEEMKQIFILYPAVHATYEEKVPLELSEELFWRKYLESEYFHRDRGKIGMSARNNVNLLLEKNENLKKSSADGNNGDDNEDDDNDNDKNGDNKKDDNDNDNDKNTKSGNDKSKKDDTKKVDENVRVATASSNDIFSRKEMELQRLREQQRQLQLQKQQEQGQQGNHKQQQQQQYSMSQMMPNRRSNKLIAIGQFDLTSTANTERGSKLLLNTHGDVHPSNDCGKKVIEKYNKHWAMVLNPNDAVAGCDLSAMARKSVRVVLDGDNDANAKGGIDEEMKRLVSIAASASNSALIKNPDGGDNESDTEVGDDNYYYGDNVLFEELALKNINAYSNQLSPSDDVTKQPLEKQLELDVVFSKFAMDEVKTMVKPILLAAVSSESAQEKKVDGALPHRKIGYPLIMALTKKLLEDSNSEKDTAKMANNLPQEFRKKFTKYFRRASELLRHFFALRRLMEIEQKQKDKESNGSTKKNAGNDEKSSQSKQKLERIATGLEDVYREIEAMKNAEPNEKLRKMFIPVMDQLDWASKLHKDGLTSSNGPKKRGGFGFVDVF